MKPRNPMGIHVHKRKAGAHGKTTKATRRKEKVALQRERNSTAEYPAFNRSMRVRFSPLLPFFESIF